MFVYLFATCIVNKDEYINAATDVRVFNASSLSPMQGLHAPSGETDDSRKGKIYLFDMARAQSQPEELRIDAASDFRLVSPQGINAWTDDATGDYVISFIRLQLG